jgi:hypothetical protein
LISSKWLPGFEPERTLLFFNYLKTYPTEEIMASTWHKSCSSVRGIFSQGLRLLSNTMNQVEIIIVIKVNIDVMQVDQLQ